MVDVRRILVTGGAGYIGSHVCKALNINGYVPVVYDNLSRGNRWSVKWGPLVIGDICDSHSLDKVLQEYRPDAVMHFAAFAYVGESMDDPLKYYRNNVAGSLTLLEAMRRNGVEMMIFSSTCTTYGLPEVIPITEDHPQRPINPYGASKLMIERMLQDFDAAYGSRYVTLRYFNAAGADPDGELGEEHDPETHLIPLVLSAAMGERHNIAIYGDNYDTPDGTCIRDYIHVTDLADAHVKALDYLLSGGVSTSLNLGIGKGFSVREVIEIASSVTKRKIARVIAPPRPGDPPALVSNAEKARAVLGWEPKYKDLETQILHAWQWMRQCNRRTG